jgi:N-dimethylarginine dimethylaminohydrolase
MAHGTENRTTKAVRVAARRRYLMCRPTYFDVTYSINPWMNPAKPTSTDLALTQWWRLHDLFVDLGHVVEMLEPRVGLPDMVFAANGAIVLDGTVLTARFRHRERAAEPDAYVDWFRERGWGAVLRSATVNEGEGDFLVVGQRILAGTGFRSQAESHEEVRRVFGREVLSLTLIDPRFYHLDTALAVLDDDEIMYFPHAFSGESRELLADRFPGAILADEADALVFGLNAVSDGLHVVLAQQAVRLAAQLRERGYEPIGVDLSELSKAGGGAKCCTLELHESPTERLDR